MLMPYLLTSGNGNTSWNLYLQDEDHLSKVSVDYEIHNGSRHWFLERYKNDGIQVTAGTPLLDQIFEKDGYYQQQSENKDWFNLEEFTLPAGSYFPRIYRPIFKINHDSFIYNDRRRINEITQKISGVNDYLPFSRDLAIISISQLSLLIDHLKLITKTVHPSAANLKSYGHEIRNLLIVVCTEVEAQLRGIYLANFCLPDKEKKRLSTKQYFTLNGPMQLNRYEVTFTSFPWLGSFAPFKGWDETKPTESLSWYSRYNQTKHDRESHFEMATLEAVFQALAALAIILKAQYGEAGPGWSQIEIYVAFLKEPFWGIKDHYIPPLTTRERDSREQEEERITEPLWVPIRLSDPTISTP